MNIVNMIIKLATKAAKNPVVRYKVAHMVAREVILPAVKWVLDEIAEAKTVEDTARRKEKFDAVIGRIEQMDRPELLQTLEGVKNEEDVEIRNMMVDVVMNRMAARGGTYVG